MQEPSEPNSVGRFRRVVGFVVTAGSVLLVYLALVVPDSIAHHRPGVNVAGGFLRLPLEGILGGALLLAVPVRQRRLVASVLGAGLGVLTVLKIINAAFLDVLGRRFNPVLDGPLFRDGFNALTESDGRGTAVVATVGALVLAVAVLGAITLAVARLSAVTARYEVPARRTVAALTAVWVVLAATGVTLFPSNPVAADSAVALARRTARQVPAALRDRRTFAAETRTDAFRGVPAQQRLTALAGKDVVIGVVESYGRCALTDPDMAPIVGPVLDAGTRQLAAAGWHARTGFLTSSTFGGGSWLAHGSFQSGLWIDNQQRYRQLIASDRLTVTRAFQEAGWQTYGVEPGNTVAWPEGKFYGYDTVYDSRNLGYRGPRFGWSRMPDQYVLARFQSQVYGRAHPPLMAEITLTSSHEPWTPVPRLVDWDSMGDGQSFAAMAQGVDRKVLWRNPTQTQIAYAQSIAYSVGSLVSWVLKYGKKNLVLVFFGDHQPFSIVSGPQADRDVPITIVAHDPTILDRITAWNFSDGLRPDLGAPVWRMNEFRDRFFTAFGAPAAAGAATSPAPPR